MICGFKQSSEEQRTLFSCQLESVRKVRSGHFFNRDSNLFHSGYRVLLWNIENAIQNFGSSDSISRQRSQKVHSED